MADTPLVSVIIPNYNHARYLDQRLQTVLNQTYRNFEVVILDDKSTDDSLEVISKYKDDPHISHIVVNERNSGSTFRQWEKGIALAGGELCWIAESDDYCELNLLEELVNAYKKRKGTVLAYSALNVVDDNGLMIETTSVGRNMTISGRQYIKRYLLFANFIRNTSCAIFSRSAAISAGDEYAGYQGAGDYKFWVNLAFLGNVAIVNRPLSYFRRHSGVVTSNRDSDGTNFIEEKRIYDSIKSQIRIHPVREQAALMYHWNRIKHQQYDSCSISVKLYELWSVPDDYSVVQKAINKVFDRFRYRHNCYL